MNNKRINKKILIDSIVIFSITFILYLYSISVDLFEEIVDFVYKYEEYELDEFITLSLFLVFAGTLFTIRRMKDIQLAFRKTEKYSKKLEVALSEIKRLEGMLPICQHCKNIRSDEGNWEKLETFVSKRTDAKFSHSICPDCLLVHHSDYLNNKDPLN